MGCLSSKPATTEPIDSPPVTDAVQAFPQKDEKPIVATPLAATKASDAKTPLPAKTPAAKTSPAKNPPAASGAVDSLPGSIPDSTTQHGETKKASSKESDPEILEIPARTRARPDLADRPSAPSRSRPGSASARPSSAGRSRPEADEAANNKQQRPGSAGRNRNDGVKPAVWLVDKSAHFIKDAESKVDKDIFRNGSPVRQKTNTTKSLKVSQEDPGPMRPTTAKRRAGRPSSAERNRGASLKPTVWLEAGTRSLYDCASPGSGEKAARPSSAEGKRDKKKKKKKKTKRSDVKSDRPASAERNRDAELNAAVWLDGDRTGMSGKTGDRPSSAGRRRAKADKDDAKPASQVTPVVGRGGAVEV